MRSKAQKTYIFLLIISFLCADVSESISIAPAVAIISRSRLIPLWLRFINARKWISTVWNKLRSLFFNNLKVGDIVKGLSDFKEYFDLFGYLNSSLNSNFTDEFTVDLQSAIIEYQKNFNLNVTGQLDENTLKTISQPRCGVPDVINGTNTMKSGTANTTSFKPWWKTGLKELRYAFDPENNVTDTVKSVFRDAFNRYSKVTVLSFRETTSFNASDIKIAFVEIDGKGGTVGGAGTNYSSNSGEIYFDSEEEWVLLLPNETVNVNGEGDVDLESVVMHQVGHVLGLGHSSVEDAVMYPIVLTEKKTELSDDDLQRIQQIYGVNSSINGSVSLHESANSDSFAGIGWERNLVLALVGGFAFVAFGLF